MLNVLFFVMSCVFCGMYAAHRSSGLDSEDCAVECWWYRSWPDGQPAQKTTSVVAVAEEGDDNMEHYMDRFCPSVLRENFSSDSKKITISFRALFGKRKKFSFHGTEDFWRYRHQLTLPSGEKKKGLASIYNVVRWSALDGLSEARNRLGYASIGFVSPDLEACVKYFFQLLQEFIEGPGPLKRKGKAKALLEVKNFCCSDDLERVWRLVPSYKEHKPGHVRLTIGLSSLEGRFESQGDVFVRELEGKMRHLVATALDEKDKDPS